MENEQQEATEWYNRKKEYMKAWREKNRETLNEKARERHNINKDKRNKRQRELYQLQKDKKQKYYVENKERILELRHKDKIRTKNTHLQSRYGITLEVFNQMLVEQESKCYICSVHIDETPKKRLCIDHCHNTGKVRKLLCTKCNTALGQVSENTEILKKMITYINEHKNE
jgi:hypothetical protein